MSFVVILFLQWQEGITTEEIDRAVHAKIIAAGAYPSPLLYGQVHFPKSICTSINSVFCHGIPDSTVLKNGDIMNVLFLILITFSRSCRDWCHCLFERSTWRLQRDSRDRKVRIRSPPSILMTGLMIRLIGWLRQHERRWMWESVSVIQTSLSAPSVRPSSAIHSLTSFSPYSPGMLFRREDFAWFQNFVDMEWVRYFTPILTSFIVGMNWKAKWSLEWFLQWVRVPASHSFHSYILRACCCWGIGRYGDMGRWMDRGLARSRLECSVRAHNFDHEGGTWDSYAARIRGSTVGLYCNLVVLNTVIRGLSTAKHAGIVGQEHAEHKHHQTVDGVNYTREKVRNKSRLSYERTSNHQCHRTPSNRHRRQCEVQGWSESPAVRRIRTNSAPRSQSCEHSTRWSSHCLQHCHCTARSQMK